MSKIYTGNTKTWACWFDIDECESIEDPRAEVEIMLRKYNYSFKHDPKTDIWSVVDNRMGNI